jgi:hypothetical protein
MVVWSGPKYPRFASFAKFGSSPSSIICLVRPGSMPSIPKTITFFENFPVGMNGAESLANNDLGKAAILAAAKDWVKKFLRDIGFITHFIGYIF